MAITGPGNIDDYAFQITENSAAKFNAFARSSRVSKFLHGVKANKKKRNFSSTINVEESN